MKFKKQTFSLPVRWLAGLAGLLIAVTLSVQPLTPVKAKTESPWKPNERVPGYANETYTPFIVADRDHYVHAFATQWTGTGMRNGIVYRKWSLEEGWTTPVDILLSPIESDAAIQGVYLDSTGMFHLLFFSGERTKKYIYYSQARVEKAASARAWSIPTIIGTQAIDPSYAAISGDAQGNLVVIYSGNIAGGGIYSVYSTDSGSTWSDPETVFLTRDSRNVPFSLRIFSGQNNTVHATWNVVTNLGADISLHYARYDMIEHRWNQPTTLNQKAGGGVGSFGPSFPSLVDTGKQVIVFYNSGNPYPNGPVEQGRPMQVVSISNDNGDTWTPPFIPFNRHQGRSGENTMTLDSDNIPHALFIQRIQVVENGEERVIGGIWHSEFKDGIWSSPERFITDYPAHDVRAVVVQGNVLFAVWRVDPGGPPHGIWFTYKTLDEEMRLPSIAYPTPIETVTAIPDSFFGIPTSTLTPIPEGLLDRPLLGTNSSPAVAIASGVIPTVVILIVLFVLYNKYQKGRP